MDRILLLVAQEEHHRVLEMWVDEEYELLTADMVVHPDGKVSLRDKMFDCCIVDVPMLHQATTQLRARKVAAEPITLPLLLLADEQEVDQIVAEQWDMVDDVLRTPLERRVVQKRIATMLRQRTLSAMLTQSKTVLNQEMTRRKLLQQELERQSVVQEQWADLQQQNEASPDLATGEEPLPVPVTSELLDDTQTIFSESLDVILIIDGEHGRILDVNPMVYPMLGYAPEFLVGKHFSFLFPFLVEHAPRDTLEHLQAYGAVFASQEFLRADGSVCPMDVTATIIPWGAGKAILTGLRDVTERKQAEAAQAQLAAIVQSSEDAIISKTIDGTILSWNNGAERVYGYRANEVVGQHVSLLVPPEHQDKLDDLFACLRRGESISHYETVRVRKDGTPIAVSLTLSPIRDTSGVITGASAIARDITRQKRMEADLVQSQARLHQILDFNPVGTLVLDADGFVRYANPQARILLNREDLEGEWLGYPLADASGTEMESLNKHVGMVVLEMRITEIDWEGQQAYIVALLDITERKQAEDMLRRMNDELEARVASRTNELSQTNAFLQKEVAQRRQAEQSLITAQARLQHLLVTSPVVIFTCKAGGDFGATFVSQNITTIFGYDDIEFTQESSFWADHIHPDDAPRIFQELPNLFIEGYHQHDYRFLHKDGSYRWVYNQLRLIHDSEGNLIEIVGSIQDITERKQAEEALKQARDRLEQRVEERTQMLQYSVQRALREIQERERAEAEAHRQANRAQALLRVAAHLNAQLDLDTLLNDVCKETVKVLHVSAASVMLHDAQQDILVLAADVGMPPEYRQEHRPIPRSVYSEHVRQKGPIVALPDVREVPDLEEYGLYQRLNIRSVVSCGMIHDGNLIGVLSIMTIAEVRHLSRDELALLQGLADQAALAIINVRQFEALEEAKALLEQRVVEATVDLRRANDELARAARLKDEFLAGMSHELRTPLNAILGMSEILQEGIYGLLTERQNRSIRTIEESGRHLLSLINDILDLSKIQAGKIELEMGVVDIESICQTSLRLVKQAAHKKRIQISTSIEATATTLQADERRLKQILVNLLSNAVKFTPEGGQVGLEVTFETDVIHFAIWDTGIGIAPEDMKRLFKPFVQVDSSLSRQYEGTGLGLSLVAELTEMHGGSVAMQSTVGEGSRFTVSLPIVARIVAPMRSVISEGENPPLPQVQQRTVADEVQRAASQPLPEQPARSVNPPTILLAEDNQTNLDTLVEYLQTRNYHVLVARNGIQALEAIREMPPALILMDIQMPMMDGLEAIRRIRADSSLAHIPIIALTALTMPGDRERCLKTGANDYLSKPVSLKGLIQAIERQLAML